MKPILVPPPHPHPRCFGVEWEEENCRCVLYYQCRLLQLINSLDTDISFIESRHGTRNTYGVRRTERLLKDAFKDLDEIILQEEH